MLRPHLGRLWLLCALPVLQALLQVGMALLTRFVIDAALSGSNLALWGGLFAADLALMILIHGLLQWLTGSIIDKSIASLRHSILRSAVFSTDLRNQGFHSGQLLSRGMEDVHTVCDGVVNALPTLLGQVTRLVGAFAAVLLISPPVAGIMALAAVLVGAAAAVARLGLKRMHLLVRKKDEIVMSKTNEPELDAFFASLRNATPEFSEDLVSSEEEKTEEVSTVEESDFSEKVEEPTPIVETSENIVSKVNDSLNNQNITSMDLLKLREELEAERNRKSQLTEELQEKMKQAAVAEKEAAAALQEQQEKMKLVQDELAAYKEENKRLVDQTQKVEETTQRQISMRQQSLDYINSLNEMMGPRAINVTVNENTRGGK